MSGLPSPKRPGMPAVEWGAPARSGSGRRPMKKSINLWAFPYPKKMSLQECFELAARAGFDAVEMNFELDGALSPAATDGDIAAIGKLARKCGIEISGVCSALYLSHALTDGDA